MPFFINQHEIGSVLYVILYRKGTGQHAPSKPLKLFEFSIDDPILYGKNDTMLLEHCVKENFKLKRKLPRVVRGKAFPLFVQEDILLINWQTLKVA